MTSICCVLTGSKYSVYDVNKLYVSLKKYTTKPFKFYCYTDHDKTRFNKQINLIPITKQDRKLQWHKTIFFKKDIHCFNRLSVIIFLPRSFSVI